MKSLDSSSAVVLFSGGQDSTTCLYWSLKHFSSVVALQFDYGQRHRIELEAAKEIAELALVPLTVLPLPAFQILGGTSLTDNIEVSHTPSDDGLPNTFVPGRNIIFLGFAAAFAYQRGIQNIVLGVCETDYSGYPDCRADALLASLEGLRLGMEADFSLHTPLMKLTKRETVLLAKEVGAFQALALSHTCYNGAKPPCGECQACILREKGFLEAGIVDPLKQSVV